MESLDTDIMLMPQRDAEQLLRHAASAATDGGSRDGTLPEVVAVASGPLAPPPAGSALGTKPEYDDAQLATPLAVWKSLSICV